MGKILEHVDLKRLARVCGFILLLPLAATILDENFRWGAFDFLVAYVLFFLAGASIQVTIRHPQALYKFSAALVFMTVAILWAVLAKGG